MSRNKLLVRRTDMCRPKFSESYSGVAGFYKINSADSTSVTAHLQCQVKRECSSQGGRYIMYR